MIETCVLCREPIELYMRVGGGTGYMHMGEGPYDHGAVRQRSDPQPYPPYDPAEQDYGPGVREPFSDDDVPVTAQSDEVPQYSEEDATNPYVPLIEGGDTTEDYHGSLAEKLKVDVKVRSNTRLFLVYLAAVAIFLVVATAAYGLLQSTPWPQSWWTCLALTVLFRIGIVFGRWRFSA